MDAATPSAGADGPLQDPSGVDPERWTRDLAALLALPSLWVDHEPVEIATGLLSVLFGVLDLEGVYARFEGPGDDDALEVWRPSGFAMPSEIVSFLGASGSRPSLEASEVDAGERGMLRVVRLSLPLPWETGLVVASARRRGFPSATDTHLLRVAVGQAAIALHTARRLAHERAARAAAEARSQRQEALLQRFVDDLEPVLASLSDRFGSASRLVDAFASSREGDDREGGATRAADPLAEHPDTAETPRLTPRETEVLGLLAQGLSNREIAGVMWLSDRTVERHITSLYRKIGVGRRSEATAFALRHGVR